MPRIHWIWAVGVAVSIIAAAQDDEPKPVLSKDPLTKEQIAVYRTVLEDYASDGDVSLNLANRTAPLELPKEANHDPCFKSLKFEPAPKPGPVGHVVDPAVSLSPTMVLVDSEAQIRIVKENDPDNLVLGKKPGDKLTDQQLDHSVNKAFETALATFSEIVFDTRHRHAVVIFSFYCGRLCGAVEILLLKRSGTKWEISKRCGGGVS